METLLQSGSSSKRRYIELLVLTGVSLAFILSSRLPHVPLCFIRYATGHDCPTCGTTRSLWNIFRGNFAAAWHFNPIGYLVLFVLVRRILTLVLRRSRFTTFLEHRSVDYALLAVFFAAGIWKVAVSW